MLCKVYPTRDRKQGRSQGWKRVEVEVTLKEAWLLTELCSGREGSLSDGVAHIGRSRAAPSRDIESEDVQNKSARKTIK